MINEQIEKTKKKKKKKEKDWKERQSLKLRLLDTVFSEFFENKPHFGVIIIIFSAKHKPICCSWVIYSQYIQTEWSRRFFQPKNYLVQQFGKKKMSVQEASYCTFLQMFSYLNFRRLLHKIWSILYSEQKKKKRGKQQDEYIILVMPVCCLDV